MKIGIDARSVVGKKAGFGQYTHNLLQALGKIDLKNKYTLFFHGKSTVNYNGFENRVVPLLRFPELWEQLQLPLAASKEKIDVLHCTGYPSPIFASCKKVVTIHDLTFHKFPECSDSLRSVLYWKIFLGLCAKTADAIITDSANSKKDIMEILKVPEEKIDIVPLAANSSFRPMAECKKSGRKEEMQIKHGLPDCFVLFVGTIEPRKNLEVLVKAFGILKKKGFKEKLVVAGQAGWKTTGLLNLINALKLEKEIIFSGYVPDEELPIFYNSASLLVYPSLYEGFGLPPLEAMQCGCPVIAANNSSFPEVIGSAGILVDALNEKSLAGAIETVLTDSPLKKKMIAAGLQQAAKFSWEKTAEQTLEVYKKVFS